MYSFLQSILPSFNRRSRNQLRLNYKLVFERERERPATHRIDSLSCVWSLNVAISCSSHVDWSSTKRDASRYRSAL